MTCEVIESLAGLEAIREEWLALWRSCPEATPFQSPQWLVPWTRHLFGGGQIMVLAMRDGGALAGLAPFFRWGTERRTVSFLGAGISDYGDLLFAPERERECVKEALSFLRDVRCEWEAVDLQELRGKSELLALQPGEFRAEECSVCPVLELASYPDSMDSKHRTDVRRARNKLAKDPALTFSWADRATVQTDMNDFLRLYAARWGEPEEPLRNFHREAAEKFVESGDLRLAVLRTGGQAAAAIYAFVSGKTLYCYLSGFEPGMAKMSPGAVLLNWVIDSATAEGLAAVDFLRQTEAYKYLWGARDRINYALRADCRAASI